MISQPNDKIAPEPFRRPSSFVFSFLKSKSADKAAVPEQAPPTEPVVSRPGWAQRLKQGLAKTREKLGGQLASVFGVGRKIDADLFDELETILITADVGVDATQALLDTLQQRVRRENLTEGVQLQTALAEALTQMLLPLQAPLEISHHRPFILMLAGVNGAGKTTTIGKLAKLYQSQGKSVLLAAGDTFRAAAREQLQVWGERNNVTVVSQEKGDSAAVIFDAITAARARNIDIVLADTAGRLPTQLHLMEEIKKVKRVIEKAEPGAPHEVLLVLDANTGQNAVAQVKAFDDALGVTGLVLTKLDGTAKGGAIAAIAQSRLSQPGSGQARPIPVRYIGVGEGVDDLRPFIAAEFVEAVFAP
jgi:fused signal recognition particle receptor